MLFCIRSSFQNPKLIFNQIITDYQKIPVVSRKLLLECCLRTNWKHHNIYNYSRAIGIDSFSTYIFDLINRIKTPKLINHYIMYIAYWCKYLLSFPCLGLDYSWSLIEIKGMHLHNTISFKAVSFSTYYSNWFTKKK